MFPITLLDCTLRDGGYYNNWHFDLNLAKEYLELCGKLGINLVETGYLHLKPGQQSGGAFANVPEDLPVDWLNVLEQFPDLTLAAMVEVKALAIYPQSDIKQMISTKLQASKVPIKVLRFAVHFSQCEALGDYINALHDDGLSICINLMQIDLATPEQVDKCLMILAKLPLTAVYLADSLGSLLPQKVSQLTRQFAARLNCAIGFHAHDNQGLALHNSLIAFEAGATWIDSTIYGMGRGAGNVKTEQIIALLYPDMTQQQQLDLYQFTARYFQLLHETYDWGAKPLYGIAGLMKMHPTYVQEIDRDRGLTTEQKLKILKALSRQNTNSFSDQTLKAVRYAEV